jgi:hypothetical protein
MFLIQVAFPPDLFSAYAMRFVPVQFRQADAAILQTDSRNALELTPATAPVYFPQSHHITDRTMDRHSLNVTDITDNFEFHCVSISSDRATQELGIYLTVK